MLRSSFSEDSSSSHVGVGVMFQQRPDNIVAVKSVIPGGPADRSGNVRVGDMIHRVNGQDVQGRSLAALRSLIMGEPGTIVTLGLVREATGNFVEVPLVRSSTGPNGQFLQFAEPNNTTRIPATTIVPSTRYGDDADRLRHALRQSEAVIKQHEDDLHNMRLMLDRQRRDADTRLVTLEEQVRRLEADRYRLEQEKRAADDNSRRLEQRARELEEQNNDLRARHGQLSEEVHMVLNKENMTTRLVEELRSRAEEERRILEQAIARDQAELNSERSRRAEAENIIAQLHEELRRTREDDRLRRERDAQNRARFEAERKRIEDIYKYSAEVAQILSSVDPRLEALDRDLFPNAAPALAASSLPLSTSVPLATSLPLSTSTSALALAPLSSLHAALPRYSPPSPPRDDAYFIA